MSFECLSATLPRKGGLLLSFQSKINNISSGLHDGKKENNQAQTPTSGTSSGTIRKLSFDPDETSSQPDLIPDESQTRHSPNTLFSPEELSLAGSPDLDFRILPSRNEPQSALFKSPQKLGSFFSPMKARKSMLTEFDDDFYERIEDYLDEEGLDIVLPAECDQSMIASRTAVRKLLIQRTFSENVIGMKDIAFGVDFEDSPGLANTVKASSLVMRRTSLGHASSSEIEEAHQTMLIKKSLFESDLQELNEIVEVSETQTLSRRSSFIVPQSLGSRKTTRKMTVGRESEWDDSFSDIHRSMSRHSTQNSTYLFLGSEQVKSLSKLSPDMKPTALAKRTNFYSPQVGLKSFNFEQVKKSPLAQFCKNSCVIEKKKFEITPFGGLGSAQAISDTSSPQLRLSLNE